MSVSKRAKFFLKGLSNKISSKLLDKDFEYYHDKYWNDLLAIQRYINESATDNPQTTWIEDIPNRFPQHIPFERVLIVGCGNGWVERELYDLGIGKKFDAFDISTAHIEMAKNQKEDRNINYFLDDMNDLKNIPFDQYDAVFNVGSLHHVFRLSRTIWTLHHSMKKDGLMFNFEYIGPAQNQYTDNHLRILEKINSEINNRFSTIIPLRPNKKIFETGDPSEAINADLVRPTLLRFFRIIHTRDINGGIAYPILWNNIEEFEKNDDDAKKTLNFLIRCDQELTKNDQVPTLFWYSVVAPKPKESIPYTEFLPKLC